MKFYIDAHKVPTLIHSVVTTAVNVHDLTPAAELLHGDEEVVYGAVAYRGIAIRPEIAGKPSEFTVAMRPGKRHGLSDTPEKRLKDLVETDNSYIRSKVQHQFRVIKHQFGFQKTRLRGMAENRCKINLFACLTNLFLARRQLIAAALAKEWCAQTLRFRLKYQLDAAENEFIEYSRGASEPI